MSLAAKNKSFAISFSIVISLPAPITYSWSALNVNLFPATNPIPSIVLFTLISFPAIKEVPSNLFLIVILSPAWNKSLA